MLDDVAHQRVLRGVAATLSWQAVDAEGEAADPGTTTVGITRADGTALKAPGTATAGTGTDPRTVALTAAETSTLDTLTATWTAGGVEHTTTVEVAGGFLFTTAELRAEQPSVSDMAKYPSDVVARERLAVEAECEWICAQAFVPRFRLVTVDGLGLDVLHLPDNALRSVRTVEVDGEALTDAQVAALIVSPDRTITRPDGDVWPLGSRVAVGYEHGLNQPPRDLKRAAMLRAVEFLAGPYSGIPARASRFRTNDSGATYDLDQATALSTGNPEVDAAYERHSKRARPGGAGGEGGNYAPASRSLQLDPSRDSLFHGGVR